MAGLKYAHRIAKLLEPFGRASFDYDLFRRRYPKAILEIDRLL
jgi:hypothetical protein